MTDFNKMLREQPIDLIKGFALHPADDIGGYRGESAGTTKTNLRVTPLTKGQKFINAFSGLFPGLKQTPKSSYTGSIAHREVAPSKKVACVNLTKRSFDKGGNEGAYTVDVTGTYDIKPGWVPTYFLPWDAGGAIVEVTIPREGEISKDSHILDPPRFFTAAINGCSIFIQGDPDRPTIHHAGGDTGRGKDYLAGAAFWREIITRFADLDKGSFKTEISKIDYITDPSVRMESGAATTQHAKDYRAWLNDKYKNVLNVQLVAPWGCVMGFRDNGAWSFYLQENVSVAYIKLSKSGQSDPANLQIVSRPLVVRKIYPNESGIANMTPALPITVSTA